jgi:hypothetical protein
MHGILRGAVFIAFCGLVAGCIQTQVLPLAPNAVRIDTHATGGSTRNTVGETMVAAAKATLAAGYTHFVLSDAKLGQGDQLAGTFGSSSGSYGGGGISIFGSSTASYRNTADAGVTVTMYRANDPAAKNAFEADAILKQYGGS